MGKKQDRMNSAEQTSGNQAAAGTAAETKAIPAPTAPPATSPPLVEEVQAFLSQRTELLKKVTAEIAATESRLAELKQTAALLAGNGHGGLPAERKKKKPKPKGSNAEMRPADAPPAESPE